MAMLIRETRSTPDTFIPGPSYPDIDHQAELKRYNDEGQMLRPSSGTLTGPRTSTILAGNIYTDEMQFNDGDIIKPFQFTSVIDIHPKSRDPPILSAGVTEAIFGLGGETKGDSVEDVLSIAPKDRPSSYDMGLFIGTKSAGTEAGSELMLGGYNSMLSTGSITSIPVIKNPSRRFQNLWALSLQATVISGTAHEYEGNPNNAVTALLTTMDNVIALPHAHLLKIQDQILGSFLVPFSFDEPTASNPYYSSLVIPCEAEFKLAFRFSGFPDIDFDVNVNDLNFGGLYGDLEQRQPFIDARQQAESTDKKLCLTLLKAAPPPKTVSIGHLYHGAPPPGWQSDADRVVYLGIPFLKSWYTKFTRNTDSNVHTVSLARAARRIPTFRSIINRPITGSTVETT